LSPVAPTAGHGGRLKLVFRADDRRLLGVHCIGDIASELVGMGQVAMHFGGTVDIFLTLALNTPTYSYAYRDAAIDRLARLSDQIRHRPGAAIRHGLDTAPVGAN
jgi:NAD(P) transhydrogenase